MEDHSHTTDQNLLADLLGDLGDMSVVMLDRRGCVMLLEGRLIEDYLTQQNLEKDDLLGKHFGNFLPPEFHDLYLKIGALVLEGERVSFTETLGSEVLQQRGLPILKKETSYLDSGEIEEKEVSYGAIFISISISELLIRGKHLREIADLVSHNLRGPLASALGLILVIQMEDGGGLLVEYQHYFEKLFGSLQALDQVIHKIVRITEQINTDVDQQISKEYARKKRNAKS